MWCEPRGNIPKLECLSFLVFVHYPQLFHLKIMFTQNSSWNLIRVVSASMN
jgi:hypothetical protein